MALPSGQRQVLALNRTPTPTPTSTLTPTPTPNPNPNPNQAHLCPLPTTELASYWQHDHAMWLHPSPDVLVLADRHDQYQLPYEETLAFNPGSFASDFAWMVYRPCAKMEAERSSLS